jgi:hypothetical protein
MNEGMILEEAGPILRVGMREAVAFLTDHVTPKEKFASRGGH